MEVVEDGSALQRLGINGGKICGLLWAAISHDVHFTIAVHTAVDVVSRRISLDSRQIVGSKIQQVLPVVLSVCATCVGTPFDELKLIRVWQIAWRFMNLK